MTVTTDQSTRTQDGPLAESQHALFRARNLHKVLGTGDLASHILRGVELEIDRSQYVSIVGASGSGKSTLLYLLGGLDRPTQVVAGVKLDPSSAVFIDGHDTSRMDDTALAQLRNEKIGFVFQFHYLLKEFTAQENVCLPMLKLGKLNRTEAMDRGAELLKRFGLGNKITRRANRLSGGEQQRVAIARALANEPAALLADEPTGNLDRKNSELVAELFAEISTRGQTIIMVTHDILLAQRAQRLISMDDGQIVGDKKT